MGLLNPGLADHGAVLQHILQIDQIAVVHVLCEIVGVVEMDDALLVRLHDVGGQQQTLGQILADLSGHVVALYAVDRGIFIGILLFHLFVVALDEGEDAVVGGIGLTNQGALITVSDIIARQLEGAGGHDLVLHHVLDLFHGNRAIHLPAFILHIIRDVVDLLRGEGGRFGGVVRLRDGGDDFISIKGHFGPISFDNVHTFCLLLLFSAEVIISLWRGLNSCAGNREEV